MMNFLQNPEVRESYQFQTLLPFCQHESSLLSHVLTLIIIKNIWKTYNIITFIKNEHQNPMFLITWYLINYLSEILRFWLADGTMVR